jgi:hypothetical protein
MSLLCCFPSQKTYGLGTRRSLRLQRKPDYSSRGSAGSVLGISRLASRPFDEPTTGCLDGAAGASTLGFRHWVPCRGWYGSPDARADSLDETFITTAWCRLAERAVIYSCRGDDTHVNSSRAAWPNG